MAIIKKTKNTGEFYTVYNNDGFKTIHFQHFEMTNYLNSRNISENCELPKSWKQDTKNFQYIKGDDFYVKMVKYPKYKSKLFPIRCPQCDQEVFFYNNEHGSKVFFDAVGKPWPKHGCFYENLDFLKNILHDKKKSVGLITYKGTRLFLLEINNILYDEKRIEVHFSENNDFYLEVEFFKERLETLENFRGHTLSLFLDINSSQGELSCFERVFSIFGTLKCIRGKSEKQDSQKSQKKQKKEKKKATQKKIVKSKCKVSNKEENKDSQNFFPFMYGAFTSICPQCNEKIFCYFTKKGCFSFLKIGNEWMKHPCDIDLKSIHVLKQSFNIFEKNNELFPVTIKKIEIKNVNILVHINECIGVVFVFKLENIYILAMHRLYALRKKNNSKVEILGYDFKHKLVCEKFYEAKSRSNRKKRENEYLKKKGHKLKLNKKSVNICEYCGEKFDNNRELKMHIYNFHTKKY